MTGTMTLVARARAWGGDDRRGHIIRVICMGLLAALILPLLMTAFAPAAHADDDEDKDNYSLYQLASNASTYFASKNAPDGGGLTDKAKGWTEVTESAADGGSLLGYADPDFSVFNIVGWLFAEISGSSQTIGYETLEHDGKGDSTVYAGMIDYAHFGATNIDLGLDSTTSASNPIGPIMGAVGGSLIWILYAMALMVGTLFWVIIQLLQLLNPFSWFYQAVVSINSTFGHGMVCSSNNNADNLVGATDTCETGGGALAGLQYWIKDWYTLLNSIAWEALVPLFIGFTIIALVMFKKMNRGSLIKKLVVRVVFIGLGLPLLGSMYTGVLNQFDDSVLSSHAGPTRVVLSTYVDFEAWMMNDRLAVPGGAIIAWDGDQASSESMMSVRTTAAAINKQAYGGNGGIFKDISVGDTQDDAETAWQESMKGMDNSQEDDVAAVFTTFGIINRYIGNATVAGSDFESGIKGEITSLSTDTDVKKSWFVDKNSYGDVERFGEEEGPAPSSHPIISVSGDGLTSSNPGKNTTTFTSPTGTAGCKFKVVDDATDATPGSCNLSPLAAFNYLNTSFHPEYLTMYSSSNSSSGFIRDNHVAVSQVGTGPAKFMYWHNAGTVLGSIVLLGFWYAIGMLVGALRRTFSLVAAVPFATLGAMAAIAKVIVYTVALILEVIVTLFIYQFVSELLISIPDIIAGPVSSWMDPDGLFGSETLGGIIVVILTLISSLLVMGVTFALLRVRKVVLQAMDEVFTKLVDKFLETNTAPKPDKSGMLPALAAGAGAGAGMAMGNKMAGNMGSAFGGGKPKTGGKTGGPNGSTNAGGLNPQNQALSAKTGLALESGKNDGPDGPDGPGGSGSGDGGGGGRCPRCGQSPCVCDGPGGSGGSGGSGGGRCPRCGQTPCVCSGGGDDHNSGGPLQLGSSSLGTSKSDKDTAQNLRSNGGLSNLGFDTKGQGSGNSGKTNFGGAGTPGVLPGSNPQGPGKSGPTGPGGSSGAPYAGGGRKAIAGQSNPTQFSTSGKPGPSGKAPSAPVASKPSAPAASKPSAPVANKPGAQPAAPTRQPRHTQGAPSPAPAVTPKGGGNQASGVSRPAPMPQQPTQKRPTQPKHRIPSSNPPRNVSNAPAVDQKGGSKPPRAPKNPKH